MIWGGMITMSLSVFELMRVYNISYEEAHMLQFKIIVIMLLIALGVLIVQLLLQRFCPKIYRKLEKLNII